MLRLISWTVTLLFVGACASTAPALVKSDVDVVGRYVVDQVNDAPLPAKLREYEQGRTELVSGGLELRRDGTFTETGAVRLVVGPVANTQNHTATGTYTVVGTNVQMTYTQGGRSVTAIVEGARLRLATATMKVTYVRKT